MNDIKNAGLSVSNNHYYPLQAHETWEGKWEECSSYASIVLSCYSDVRGTMYLIFSPDANHEDSIFTFNITGESNEVHRITVSKKYFKIRYTNNSTNQTEFRLQTLLGQQQSLTSPLNAQVQKDGDALVVKAIPSEFEISAGRFTGYSIVNKFGRNTDIDSGSTPEDIWDSGGTYTGFPTGSPEELEVFSSNAGDTGILTITYLPTNTSETYSTVNATLQGTTPVNTGVTAYRVHTARYNSGGSGFNLGNITVRHRVTTANVFLVMPIGTSQTYTSAYTIPYASTGVLTRLFCRILSNTASQIEGALYIRTGTDGPRLRRPFSASNTNSFEEEPFGGLRLEAMSDIMVRITLATANNLDVIAGYDILIIRD